MSEWFSRFGFAPVTDGLLSGAYPLDADDVRRLAAEGIVVAYNLCEEDEYAPGQREAVQAALAETGIEERRLPMTDYGRLSAESLDRAVNQVLGELEEGRRVYLHCRAGWQRSAAVAAAVIAHREGIGLGEALTVLRERKPPSEPLPHQRADLIQWWLERQTPSGKDDPRR
jgi:atypical dual specificity phosphatase